VRYSAGGERLECGAAGVDAEWDPLVAQLVRDELVQPLLHLQQNFDEKLRKVFEQSIKTGAVFFLGNDIYRGYSKYRTDSES
jgi:hypothetical protein